MESKPKKDNRRWGNKGKAGKETGAGAGAGGGGAKREKDSGGGGGGGGGGGVGKKSSQVSNGPSPKEGKKSPVAAAANVENGKLSPEAPKEDKFVDVEPEAPEEVSEEELQRRREAEEEERKKQELATLQDFIEEAKRRNAWKSELREANRNAENSRPDESDFHKLDSSLKKNTAFIRKLKNFTEAQREAVKKEMVALNLTKYVGEVASAFVEAKLKMTDLAAAVEICSFLHQRYAEFSQQMLECWQKALSFKKESGEGKAVANPSKLRVDLRFYSEMVSVGIFTLKEGLPLLGQLLTHLVAVDKEEHANISIVLAFCKHCGDDYAGLLPRKIRVLADRHSYAVPTANVLPAEKQKNLRQLLRDYYKTASKHLVEEYRELQNTERTNRKILLTKGEVHAERREKAEALQLSYSKLFSNTEQLADVLDEDMPDLAAEDKKDEDDIDEVAELEAQVEESALGELWEDDEMKSFYENLPDLKAIIPAILYKDSSKEAALAEDKVEDDADAAGEEEEEVELQEVAEEDVAPPFLEDEPEETETQNTSAKMVFDAFLSKLPSCVSRDLIDSAAIEFCMNMNTKNNRKKLVKTLFSVPRSRIDLLPFYSRLVATLYPCMPEVAVDLAQYLKQDFRYQVRKKDQINVENKLKVCRFIGEMVKFKMFLKTEALFCIKMLLYDFRHHQIEMACTMVESCGRFLFRSPESHNRTKLYLEQMVRKKTALSMDSRYSMMIENAICVANPPQVPAMPKVTKPPLHEYISKLFFDDLCKSNTEKVLRQVRKLDWADPEVSGYAIRCLGAVWNVKFYNVRFIASLLAGLVSHHEWVGPQVVDGILEDIRLQMEINDPKHNQRRVSVAKYLAELYTYRLVDSGVVFKVLYSFLTFGNAFATAENPSLIDPPEHLFRIRLVCVVLDTCGTYFNAGSSKKKLDYFFAYFQRYVWQKRSHPVWSDDSRPFPIPIVNVVSETMAALRPKIQPCTSLEEANEAVEKIEKEVLESIREKAPELAKTLRGTTTYATEADNAAGLGTIAEEGDEEQAGGTRPHSRKSARTNDSDDEDDDSNSRSRSQSQYDHYDIDDEEEDEEDESTASESESEVDDDEDGDDDDDDDDSSEDDEDVDEDDHDDEIDDDVALAPEHIACDEDDEFTAMLDKMVNDNIAESRSAALPRGQQMNMIAPMHSKSKKGYDQLHQPPPEEENTVQFSVLLRKNNKPSYREIAVPKESDIARKLQMQEEADRLEKERVKKLTLEINERQEEEDLNEAIAALQRPTLVNVNRGRRQHYQPPKGVPDADAIFGSGPRRQNPR